MKNLKISAGQANKLIRISAEIAIEARDELKCGIVKSVTKLVVASTKLLLNRLKLNN